MELVGLQLGNYLVRELAGEGAMALVYLAEHRALDRKVAVKVLKSELASDPQMVDRFMKEAQMASAIRSPHVADVFDVGALQDGRPFFSMEWLPGRSLADILRSERRFSVWRAIHIARGISDGLEAAHARGIVHRDLKPENVFLVYENDDADFAKVLDFGIARSSFPSVVERKTEAGSLWGTPFYMSPEQLRGEAVDARADLYSLGVIVFEMLTGRLPFVAEQLGELLVAHLTQSPPSMSSLDSAISPALDAVVRKALAKDPTDRFTKLSQFVAALEQARDELPRASAPGGACDETQTIVRARPRYGRRAGLATSVALVAGVVGFAVRTSHAPAPTSESKIEAGAPLAALAPVAIEIHAEPASAELFIDDKKVENPLSRSFPAGEWSHLIEARAPGYVPKSSWVSFEKERVVTLALEPVPVSPPPPSLPKVKTFASSTTKTSKPTVRKPVNPLLTDYPQ